MICLIPRYAGPMGLYIKLNGSGSWAAPGLIFEEVAARGQGGGHRGLTKIVVIGSFN